MIEGALQRVGAFQTAQLWRNTKVCLQKRAPQVGVLSWQSQGAGGAFPTALRAYVKVRFVFINGAEGAEGWPCPRKAQSACGAWLRAPALLVALRPAPGVLQPRTPG